MDIQNPVAACLSNEHKLDEEKGGMFLHPHFFPPLSITHMPFNMAAPAHQNVGGLAKVVNGQPEHVIGAHP